MSAITSQHRFCSNDGYLNLEQEPRVNLQRRYLIENGLIPPDALVHINGEEIRAVLMAGQNLPWRSVARAGLSKSSWQSYRKKSEERAVEGSNLPEKRLL